ncbi:MAG: hypothetical protein WC242_00320 [Candidatus Paceibacterota bacterium]|jgi:hypothetical protein
MLIEGEQFNQTETGEIVEQKVEDIRAEEHCFGEDEGELVLNYLKGYIERHNTPPSENDVYAFLSGKPLSGEQMGKVYEEWQQQPTTTKWAEDLKRFYDEREEDGLSKMTGWIHFDTAWTKRGEQEKREETKYRFYFNPKDEYVGTVFQNLITLLEGDPNLGFGIKTHSVFTGELPEGEKRLVPEEAFRAKDRIVLYVEEKSANQVLGLLRDYVESHKDWFNEDALPFSAKIKDKTGVEKLPGISMAGELDRESQGRNPTSFTGIQARIIQRGLKEMADLIENPDGHDPIKADYLGTFSQDSEIQQWALRIQEEYKKRKSELQGRWIDKERLIHECVVDDPQSAKIFPKVFRHFYERFATLYGIDLKNIAFYDEERQKLMKDVQ